MYDLSNTCFFIPILSYFVSVGTKLKIVDVQKRHAGILQCMAINPLGSVYGAAMLQVSPKQVTANTPLDPEELPYPGTVYPILISLCPRVMIMGKFNP